MSLLRCEEPGWERCALRVEDSSGRRGVWVRSTHSDEDLVRSTPYGPFRVPALLRLEVCAGREGDDAYLDLRPGLELTEAHLRELEGILGYAIPWLDLPEEADEGEKARVFEERERAEYARLRAKFGVEDNDE